MLPLIEAFKKDLYHCADCNYCVDAVWPERGIEHVCPTMEHHTPLTSYSGRGYIAAARAWLEGADLDLNALGERAFTCTTCGNCEQVCPIGLRPRGVAHALRGELWATESVPSPIADFRRRVIRDGNPNGVEGAARANWAAELSITTAARETVMYLPGCAAATAIPAEAKAACALITAAGLQVTTLVDDSCCGAPLYEIGCDREASSMADALANKVGTATIVTSGLECWCSWQRGSSRQAPSSFIGWLTNVLREKRMKLQPRASLPSAVHVLDSCQSRIDASRELREILSNLGIACTPSLASARYAVCCGAAGGMPSMQGAAAARMAAGRLDESPTAAEIIVSADPRCVAHLRGSTSRVTVFGIAEFLLTYCDLHA